jgi:hypothetical protein
MFKSHALGEIGNSEPPIMQAQRAIEPEYIPYRVLASPQEGHYLPLLYSRTRSSHKHDTDHDKQLQNQTLISYRSLITKLSTQEELVSSSLL